MRLIGLIGGNNQLKAILEDQSQLIFKEIYLNHAGKVRAMKLVNEVAGNLSLINLFIAIDNKLYHVNLDFKSIMTDDEVYLNDMNFSLVKEFKISPSPNADEDFITFLESSRLNNLTRLFVGTTNDLFILDLEHDPENEDDFKIKNISHLLENQVINYIYEEKSIVHERLWVGTENGLFIFDGKEKYNLLKHYHKKNSSLPSNSVIKILPLNHSKLLVTIKGIVLYPSWEVIENEYLFLDKITGCVPIKKRNFLLSTIFGDVYLISFDETPELQKLNGELTKSPIINIGKIKNYYFISNLKVNVFKIRCNNTTIEIKKICEIEDILPYCFCEIK